MKTTSQSNMALLQKAGIVHKEHRMTKADQGLVEKLTRDEVQALISVKKKLGTKMIKKVMKGGKFPHPDSFPL